MDTQENVLIDYLDFTKVCMRAGTIIHAKENFKAKKQAYILKTNFGEFGIKTSSAQITEHYTLDTLIGKQVIAVMNFPPKRIAGISSEVLVLGCVSENDGTILLQPSQKVANGARIL